jgi:restriction endonuclease S subunit
MAKKKSAKEKAKYPFETLRLKEIADVLRLPPTLKDEKAKGGKKVNVLMQSDLPLYGYASGASQTFTLSKETVSKIEKYFLKPNDVILVGTGDNIGKTHIVGEDVDGATVATGTLFTIRFGENQKDNAVSLASFLNSSYGKEIFEKLKIGAKLKRINSKALRSIEVPLLTTETKKQAKQLWNSEIKGYEKMLEYRNKIEEARQEYLAS